MIACTEGWMPDQHFKLEEKREHRDSTSWNNARMCAPIIGTTTVPLMGSNVARYGQKS